ncbi:MAG: fluoride efflux transporter CrcB [Candidatus Symbiothrix sp.]|jgi:CrcB protein|nr:fluoride efflux transporter CrcB [Candidatus Symbiothrix sp.]
MKQILLVGLGGGAGSILRFLASKWLVQSAKGGFPLATFAVNVIGCLLIGLLIGWSYKHSALDADMRALLVAGFCGGFTTFSAFSLENMQLFQAGQYGTLLFYVLATLIIGFLAVYAGFWLTK